MPHIMPTLKSIVRDLQAGNTECLYLASQDQINTLLQRGLINEDYEAHYNDSQEEMRLMFGSF